MGLLQQWASGSKGGVLLLHAYDMLMVWRRIAAVEVQDAYLEDAERLLLETGYVAPCILPTQSSRLLSTTGLLTRMVSADIITSPMWVSRTNG